MERSMDSMDSYTNGVAASAIDDPAEDGRVLYHLEEEIQSSKETASIRPAFSGVVIDDCKGGHEKRVTSVEWNIQGDLLASSSEDRTVCLWTMEDGRDPFVSSSISGHRDYVERVRWCPSNQSTLATGSLDKTACLWDVRIGKQTASIDVSDPCLNIQWSPDGNSIVTLLEPEGNGAGSIINIIDVRAIKKQYHPRRIRYPETIQDLSFSACGDYLFLASSHGIPSSSNGYGVIEVVGFRPHPEPKQSALRKLYTLEGHSSPTSAIAVSPTGDIFASGDEDSLVQIWGLNNLECLQATDCFNGPLLSLSFNSSGEYLAAAMEDESLAVVDVVQNRLVYKFTSCVGVELSLPQEEKMLTPATAESDATFEKTVVSYVDWHPSKRVLAASLDTGRNSLSSSAACVRVITFGEPISYCDDDETTSGFKDSNFNEDRGDYAYYFGEPSDSDTDREMETEPGAIEDSL